MTPQRGPGGRPGWRRGALHVLPFHPPSFFFFFSSGSTSRTPPVVIFRPLIARCAARGHEVTVTSREFAQTVGLLERFGIPHTVVGAHGGASRRGKARAMAGRSARAGARSRAASASTSRSPTAAPTSRWRRARRHAPGDDVRLRVRGGDAPLERPPRHPGARAGGDPRGGPGALRHPPAAPGPLPGAQGGVLPRRPRDRRGRGGRAGPRPRAGHRGRAPPPEVTLYHRGAEHRPLRRDAGPAARGAGGADRGAAPHRRAAAGARRRPGGRARAAGGRARASWRRPTWSSAPGAR